MSQSFGHDIFFAGSASFPMADSNRPPYLPGAVLGGIAWLLGYVVTYLLAASDVRETPLQRFFEAVDGEPATYEMVGWIFYNAHFVDTVFENIPVIGSWTTEFIRNGDALSPILYLVPVGVLLATGLALARYVGSDDVQTGAMAGLTAVPGYLLLSVAGVFLFRVTIGGASAAPDLLPAIVLAGLVYPAICAGAGGALAGLVDE